MPSSRPSASARTARRQPQRRHDDEELVAALERLAGAPTLDAFARACGLTSAALLAVDELTEAGELAHDSALLAAAVRACSRGLQLLAAAPGDAGSLLAEPLPPATQAVYKLSCAVKVATIRARRLEAAGGGTVGEAFERLLSAAGTLTPVRVLVERTARELRGGRPLPSNQSGVHMISDAYRWLAEAPTELQRGSADLLAFAPAVAVVVVRVLRQPPPPPQRAKASLRICQGCMMAGLAVLALYHQQLLQHEDDQDNDAAADDNLRTLVLMLFAIALHTGSSAASDADARSAAVRLLATLRCPPADGSLLGAHLAELAPTLPPQTFRPIKIFVQAWVVLAPMQARLASTSPDVAAAFIVAGLEGLALAATSSKLATMLRLQEAVLAGYLRTRPPQLLGALAGARALPLLLGKVAARVLRHLGWSSSSAATGGLDVEIADAFLGVAGRLLKALEDDQGGGGAALPLLGVAAIEAALRVQLRHAPSRVKPFAGLRVLRALLLDAKDGTMRLRPCAAAVAARPQVFSLLATAAKMLRVCALQQVCSNISGSSSSGAAAQPPPTTTTAIISELVKALRVLRELVGAVEAGCGGGSSSGGGHGGDSSDDARFQLLRARQVLIASDALLALSAAAAAAAADDDGNGGGSGHTGGGRRSGGGGRGPAAAAELGASVAIDGSVLLGGVTRGGRLAAHVPPALRRLAEALSSPGGDHHHARVAEFAEAACGALPSTALCNNPRCASFACSSERELVGGKGCVCAGCRAARFCSKDCQRAAWKWHKEECRRRQRAREAPQHQEQQEQAAAAAAAEEQEA